MDEHYPILAEEVEGNDSFDLPPGFRFHPTDDELITHYLSSKALDHRFLSRAIGEVELNRVEPWELPWRAKMGEKEWYFFCVRDRKYPTGMRTNRATGAGYWKATGKDKEIYRKKALVGMKKTLVFYKGRAPKGVKTNWVMHEYRLEGSSSCNLQNYSKNEWVICRVFQKTTGGKKADIPGSIQPKEFQNSSTVLPPLTDSSPYNCNGGTTTPGEGEGCASHAPCFSDLIEDKITAKTMPHVEFQKSNADIGTLNPEYPDCFGRGQHRREFNLWMSMQSSGMKYLNPGFSPALTCFDRVDGGDHPHQQPVDLDCFWQYGSCSDMK